MNLDKIVMIGPVYPYKGGISHYTSLMYRSLSQKYNVYMMSYKVQYPRFLFKKEQKDYGNDTFRIGDTDFYIDTANPANWLRTVKRIRQLKPDLIIIQWWHPYFAPCYWSICKGLKNTPIMFLCHNVFPHERFCLDKFLTKLTLKRGDYFIVQSSQDEADLKSIKPEAHYKKTVHPTYNAFKIKDMTKQEARSLLKIPEKDRVLLFFGFVREYKGLKYLLQAMPDIMKKLDEVRLLIVGDFPENKAEYLKLIEKLGIVSVVDIYDGYIPDKEVEKFFAASDLVTLPYISATQSGIVQIAYGFEKPVIATNVGGLPEVVLDRKTGYIVESQNSTVLAQQIIRFFKENKASEFHQGIKEESYRYSWERMAETVENLYDHK